VAFPGWQTAANHWPRFLWVDLQLQSLRNCQPKYVKAILNDLPRGLDATYERILADFHSNNAVVSDIRRIFECVAFAARPLSLEELAEVLAIDFDSSRGATLQPSSRLVDTDDIFLTMCPGLLQTVEHHHLGRQEVRKTVQFTHASVQEYLLSNRLANSLPSFHTSETSAHITLAKMCFATLNSLLPLTGLPFSDYAARNWHVHVSPGFVARATHSELCAFLHPDSQSFLAWQHVIPWDQDMMEARFPLYWAARLGLIEHVTRLLNTHSESGNGGLCTALYAALQWRRLEITPYLLKHSVVIESRGEYGSRPLHLACQNGYIEVARALIENGVSIEARDLKQRTPLHLAAQSGAIETVQDLLENGAAIEACDENQLTLLHLAAWFGTGETVNTLLTRGAAIDVRDERGETPLHLAAEAGNTASVRFLLKNGAAIEACNESQKTPLHLTATWGQIVSARALLESGAFIEARDCRGRTPLHDAMFCPDPTLACFLLDRGADIEARDKAGKTPLYLAAEYDIWSEQEMSNVLLKRGAAVNTSASCGSTILHRAALSGQLGLISTCLQRGVQLESRNEDGQTALHLAALRRRDHDEPVKLLLNLGADPNARTHGRHTALVYAASRGNVDIVRVLLASGTSIDARDSDGFRAIDYACAGRHPGVVHLLLEHGGCSLTENPPHGSYLDIANRACRAGVVKHQPGMVETWEDVRKREDSLAVADLLLKEWRIFGSGERMLRRVRRVRSFVVARYPLEG
jgi:ankyrin repeat protein